MSEKKYLDQTGLALVWQKIKGITNNKVDKVDGKGLSTNDYTSDEKTKLANIETGAQVNVLEGVMVNGSTVSVTNKIANIAVPTKTSDITNDSGFITTSDIPEGAAASITVPKMDGTANAGTELAFARGDHVHPTDTSRASASTVTAIASTVVSLDSRVGDLETAVGTGGSVDSKIQTAIQGLDSSIAATSNEAIQAISIVDGKINSSTKITIPTNNNQLTNGAGYQTASDVSSAISGKANAATSLSGYGITDAYTKTETQNYVTGLGYQTASDVNSAISGAITTVMDYKGTKATTAALPTNGNKQGDVWHVTADNSEYAWNGSAWQELGTPIDLSGYVQDAELIPISSTTINTICV